MTTTTPLVVDTDDHLVNLFVNLVGAAGLAPTVTGRIGPREMFDNIVRAAPFLKRTDVRVGDGLATVETGSFDLAWSVFTDGTSSTAIFILTRFDDDFAGHLLRSLMEPLEQMATATGLVSSIATQGTADEDVVRAMKCSRAVPMSALLSGGPLVAASTSGPAPTDEIPLARPVDVRPEPARLSVPPGDLAGSIASRSAPPDLAAPPVIDTHVECVVELQKGQNTVLSVDDLGTVVDIHLGWAAATGVELDASAILLGENSRVLSDEHFVFFNNLESPDGSVRLTEELVEDSRGIVTAVATVDLDRVDPRVTTIVFAVSIYDAHSRGHSYREVSALTTRVTRHGQDAVYAAFTADRLDGSETAMIAFEIYRRAGQWKIRAVGQGYAEGLAGIARDYGVAVN